MGAKGKFGLCNDTKLVKSLEENTRGSSCLKPDKIFSPKRAKGE